MIIAGSAVIMALLDRFPVLVWAGAALLGWMAGELIVSDVGVIASLGAETAHAFETVSALCGAALVVSIGALLTYNGRRTAALRHTTK